MNFSDYYNTGRISESIVDIPRDSLDPDVFVFFDDGRLPILKDGIKSQIMKDINSMDVFFDIADFFIIGSILTPYYTEKSDIDINVHINDNMDVVSTGEILHLINRINGKLAISTRHPINYYIMQEDYDLDKTDAAYDIANERWLKLPQTIEPDVGNILNKFQQTISSLDITTGSLRRTLIDLTDLRKIKSKNLKKLQKIFKEKIEDLNQNIKTLSNMYRDIVDIRHMAFDRYLTPQELQLYGSKNRLPENIMYKLLEKYYYIDFLKQIDKIIREIEDHNQPLTMSKLDKIKNVAKDFINADL